MKPGRRYRRIEAPEPDLPRDERRRLVLPRPRTGDRSTPRRAPGEGWRSVGLSVVVSAILAGLALYTDTPVERVEAVAMWIVVVALGGLAGKDIGRVADAAVETARALRGKG